MTKVVVVSGFLGAGKTTFIKKLVEEAYKGEKIVLIENEFGEVGIDGGFMKNAGIEVSELNSGCICCSLVGDFGRNLKEVYEQFHPDRIIIEPSGVGKLSDVSASIVDVQEEGLEVEIESLITVANAMKATKMMKAFGEFYMNQLEFANTIVLSRTQNTSDEKLEAVVAEIRKANPEAAIITTPWDELGVNVILSAVESKKSMLAELLEEAEEAHEAHEHEHHHDHDEDEDEHEHHHHHHHDHDEDEHEHEHHHHHHHDHDEDEDEHEHHHEHGPECTCGCHDHDHDHEHEHHHHHHADEVFTSVGIETPHKFDRAVIEEALKTLTADEYESTILRAKGIVPTTDGSWIEFDMVPGEYELREGSADYTGRLVVIGTEVTEEQVRALFGC